MDDLSSRVRCRMKEMGMLGPDGEPNVSALQKAAGVKSYATVHGIANGDITAPTVGTVARIAAALRVSVGWLLGEDTFDVRAYDIGRREVADEVTAAIERALAVDPSERRQSLQAALDEDALLDEVASEKRDGNGG